MEAENKRLLYNIAYQHLNRLADLLDKNNISATLVQQRSDNEVFYTGISIEFATAEDMAIFKLKGLSEIIHNFRFEYEKEYINMPGMKHQGRDL